MRLRGFHMGGARPGPEKDADGIGWLNGIRGTVVTVGCFFESGVWERPWAPLDEAEGEVPQAPEERQERKSLGRAGRVFSSRWTSRDVPS